MIDLGSTDFYFRVSSLPREEFEAFSNRLFDVWDAHVERELNLEDYALSLEIEEGSIKGKGKVLAKAAAVYICIAEYGSFIQGVQIIYNQVTDVGKYLVDKAHGSLGSNPPKPEVRRRSGVLGKLKRLFIKVKRNEITVEEALKHAQEIIGSDADDSPEFMTQLSQAITDLPRDPEQYTLQLDGFDEEPVIPAKESDEHSRLPKPQTPIPPTNQLRIEIWRESKRGKKKVKVVEL